MSEFCQQCAPTVDAEHPLDELAGLCKEGELTHVICEGCGWTYVDETGTCVGPCRKFAHLYLLAHHPLMGKAQ